MSGSADAPSDHLLRTLASVPPASRVLDLGCGTGRHTAPLSALGFDLYACDADEAHVDAARNLLRPALGEATARRITPARPAALGYPDAYFDWVVAYGAYDGAADAAALEEMLAETQRVLRPGGWVYAALKGGALGAEVSPEALTARFEAAGFALAEAPVRDAGRLRGIYRKVDADTVG